MIVLLTKDTAWKVKCSTGTIPTLDILNRNYEKIIKGRIFKNWHQKQVSFPCRPPNKTDLTNYQWVLVIPLNTLLPLDELSETNLYPAGLLLLRSYVTRKYLICITNNIKLNIWKKRAIKWKEWKVQHEITKHDFKTYHVVHHSSRYSEQ